MNMYTLYTIGYSDLDFPEFINTLKGYNIDSVADVRSQPYSKFRPDFCIRNLRSSLNGHGLQYIFLGDELGARRKETDCYINNRISYALVAKTSKFREGLDRLRSGLCKMNIALLCAEKDPIDCHRLILVCRHAKAEIEQIVHIMDGKLEDNAETERRLLQVHRLKNLELFRSNDQILAEAYEKQETKIAYTRPQDSS